MRAGLQQRLLFEMTEAWSQVLASIAGLSEEQMNRPAIGGWSVKDHLSHMTVWHEMRFHEVSRIARGGQPAYQPFADEQLEVLNTLTVAFGRHLPVSQVLADLEFARSLVAEAIAGCPEEALDEKRYGEVGCTGTSHDVSHAAAIRAWREREGL
jgi:hypothetical protein